MLERIDTKEIMTVWEAMNKYRTKHFCMVTTEHVNEYGGFNDLGYVIYTADSEQELTVPTEEKLGREVGYLHGVAAEPLQVGGYQIQ